MRLALTAFLIGVGAIAAVLLVTALALGVVADAGGWRSFELSIGPLVVVEFMRSASSTATTFGPGVPALALVGGVLNAVAAAWLARRMR
jgi:hypothetical protein